MAASYLRRERHDHTLQPTALVNEAYLRLVDQQRASWQNRAQFFGVAAQMMRRILINHANERVAAKRGGGAMKVSLSEAESEMEISDASLLALDESLTRLSQLDPRKGRIIELKFFGGLKTEEIGEVMALSHATIEREWTLARAWLHREMKR
jgi:RNA polymerase sigma factor (TIGR02999 family)